MASSLKGAALLEDFAALASLPKSLFGEAHLLLGQGQRRGKIRAPPFQHAEIIVQLIQIGGAAALAVQRSVQRTGDPDLAFGIAKVRHRALVPSTGQKEGLERGLLFPLPQVEDGLEGELESFHGRLAGLAGEAREGGGVGG